MKKITKYSMGETTKATGGALSGLGTIGFGIYGIGETHGYLNTTIFIIIAITGIYFTSQYLGSRKIRDAEIVYNPNEFFLVTFFMLRFNCRDLQLLFYL